MGDFFEGCPGLPLNREVQERPSKGELVGLDVPPEQDHPTPGTFSFGPGIEELHYFGSTQRSVARKRDPLTVLKNGSIIGFVGVSTSS